MHLSEFTTEEIENAIKTGNVAVEEATYAFWREDVEEYEKMISEPEICGVNSECIQKHHTPHSLRKDMVGKLGKDIIAKSWEDSDFSILTYNPEFVRTLVDFGVKQEAIFIVSDNKNKCIVIKKMYNKINVQLADFLVKEFKMKFDVIIMNPPYQDKAREGGQKGTRTHIWGDFIKKGFFLLKEKGFLCTINPGGWRRPFGKFKEIGNQMMARQIKNLNIHGISDGQKLFDATTGFDVVVIENTRKYKKTVVVDDSGKMVEIDMAYVPAIANGKISEISELFAKKGEEKVQLIFDRSAYGHDKAWVCKEKSPEFKYPVVYSLPQKGMCFHWSSTNKNGHFGIPKIIWSNGAATQILIDEKGEYGMTEWAYAIADNKNVLPLLKKAMESVKFLQLCNGMRFTLDKYDAKFISLFRKDFWKKFVDEKGNEI